MKKKNFKKEFEFKINQNLEFFHEYAYIYKKSKLFKNLSFENQDLYNYSKKNKNLTNKNYKKLYNRAIDISYGVDHIADTIGLFTKKIKKPVMEETSILEVKFNKSDTRHINFNCGDLYLRKNVIPKNDNIHCYKTFSKFVDTLNNKLTRFSWQMSYNMPVSKKEIKKLVETQTKKHSLLTGPVWMFTISYNMNWRDIYNTPKNNNNILYLTSDLIWTDLKAVIKLTKKLKNLSKIYFVDYNIVYQPVKFKHKEGLRHYIINNCENQNFKLWSSAPRLKNTSHLDKLKEFRKDIDKKVQIKFFNNDYDGDDVNVEVGDHYKDDCQKILEDAKII